MVTKKHRFSGQNGVRYLFKKGSTVRGQLFSTRYLQNNRTTDWRVAVVVSKKVTKSAPKRNRIRRRIYEIFRLNAPQYLKNHDVAIIVFSDKLSNMPHQELEQLVLSHLKQISKNSKK